MSSTGIIPSNNPGFDEGQWIIQIRRTLDEDLLADISICVCIFSVPRSLLTIDPDSYIPQQVPMGPYHYWRPEMYEMERYKLAAAKRMQQNLKDLKFEDVVLQLQMYEHQIRGCYHKRLAYKCETLAWLMAVDACFLLEFLEIYALKNGKLLHGISSRISHLVDITGRVSAHNAVIRDMVKLENQIPLFVLRKMSEIKFSSLEINGDNELFKMLMGFSQVLSPFKTMEDLSKIQAMECAHLLDFLYHLIVPKFDHHHQKFQRTESFKGLTGKAGESTEINERQGTTLQNSSHLKKLLDEVWKIFSKLNKLGPVRIIKSLLSSKIIVFLTKLPWKIISNIPGIKILKGPLEALSGFFEDKEEKAESEASTTDDKPPLLEEIAIPSVSDLSKAYVNFLPTEGGILSIKFDEKTRTFYLPSINLDEKTEVLMKNLVAYEACNASGPVIFTRYTELMNGIIDTEEDAKILREKGIILNHLKSDAEAAKLWNGMNRCVRLTKEPQLDKVIREVNKFYNGRWKVKFGKVMKAYVYGSWKILTLLACVMLLLLMTLQSFCSVYNCERIIQAKVMEDHS